MDATRPRPLSDDPGGADGADGADGPRASGDPGGADGPRVSGGPGAAGDVGVQAVAPVAPSDTRADAAQIGVSADLRGGASTAPARRSTQQAFAPPPSAQRCPYCHDALASNALAGDCVRCGTRHHASCFAEHGGCSTHGCGSTRAAAVQGGARVGVQARPEFAPLSCGDCREPLPRETMVARCDGCGGILHVACYERLGACGAGASRCRGPVSLMPHVEAAAAHLQVTARALLFTGIAWLALTIALAVFTWRRGEPGPAASFVALSLLGALLAGGGWSLGRRARRLAASAPPPRGPAADTKPPWPGSDS